MFQKFRSSKVISIALVLIMVLSLVGCAQTTPSSSASTKPSAASTSHAASASAASTAPTTKPSAASSTPAPTQKPAGAVSQGVSDKEILIGCNMATTGSYAFVGVPIVDTLSGIIARINAKGGIRGRQLRLIHYDDGYDPATGKALVEKLVEEDKVFALCCLGGDIVTPSLDYIKSKGIPTSIISGLQALYSDSAPKSAIFPVQPSGITDGQFILARLLHESVFGPQKNAKLPATAKIGVIVTTAEGSQTTLQGIMKQAEKEGVKDRLMVETVTSSTYSTSIQKMKSQGVLAVINTVTDSKGIVAAMDDAGWEVPYVGYYGASTPQSYSPETYKPGRPIYATTWADYSSAQAKAMLADLDDALSYNKSLSADTLKSYKNNLYARAGYATAISLAIGLDRLDKSGLDLTWENLTKCMEQAPFELGAIGYFNYANGSRLGVTKLSFTEYVVDATKTGTMLSTRPFESLDDVTKK